MDSIVRLEDLVPGQVIQFDYRSGHSYAEKRTVRIEEIRQNQRQDYYLNCWDSDRNDYRNFLWNKIENPTIVSKSMRH